MHTPAISEPHHYVTYFDKNYLVKGHVLLTSLRRHDPHAHIRVICLDDDTFHMLAKLDLAGVEPIPLALFEKHDATLQACKANRTLVQYYWTLTPTLILRCLDLLPKDSVLTYVDADMFFFSSPAPLFEELGENDILIHRHNFSEDLKHLEAFGHYNVGLMIFRNSAEGRRVLTWWRAKCIEWCGDTIEPDPEGGTRFGDQKYLERFETLSPNVGICQHPGAGVAPWNHTRFALTLHNGVPHVDGQPTIFYHYHSFTLLAPACALPTTKAYPYTLEVMQLFVAPYFTALREALAALRTVHPEFNHGFRPDTLKAGLCVLACKELESEIDQAFPLRVDLDDIYVLGVERQLAEYEKLSQQVAPRSRGRSLEQALSAYQRFLNKPRLLNLGCGRHMHAEWLNIDIAPSHPAVYDVDLRGPWPLPMDFFDVVYHSHVLEHMSAQEGHTFLRKCFEVLKPGGTLRVAIPDLEGIARHYLTALNEAKNGDEGAADRHAWMLLELIDQTSRHHSGGAMAEYFKQVPLPQQEFVLSRVGWEGEQLAQALQGKIPRTTEEHDPAVVGAFRLGGEVHRWMYDAFSLRRALEAAGFVNARQVAAQESAYDGFASFELDADAHGKTRKPDSLFMEARKPEAAATDTPETERALPTIHYAEGRTGNWTKQFPDWESACAAAGGYADQSIFEKVFAAAMQVKKGMALWERDSVLFYQEDDNTALLTSLLHIAEQAQGHLHVLDFGGALGSTYTQHQQRFAHCPHFSWSIVEQPHFTAAGKRFFADEHVSFFDTLEEALQTHPINVVLFSSVIQYLAAEHFTALIHAISKAGIPHIVIDRTPFRQQGTLYTIQEPHSIYPDASYPMRLPALADVDVELRKAGYQYISSEPALDGTWSDCAFLRLHYARKENAMPAPTSPHAFETVYFEISGICNGKCPYCVTGRSTATGAGKFVNPDLFEAACAKMVRLGLLNKQSLLHLYIWGEPTLHPKFSELLERTRNFPFGTALSTNASKVPDITDAFVEKVRTVRFSCSGFSQQSYDRIHGFRFSNVRANMMNFVQQAREKGSRAAFTLNFHLYQFNLDEIPEAKAFAQSLGIRFSPNYAILNDWDLSQRWVAGTLSAQEERRIGRELFNDLPAQLLEKAPHGYACPQGQYLVINELGQIMICCQTPSEDTFAAGNIMDANVLEHIANRQNSPVCSSCVSSGMAYMFNNSLACPAICK